MLTFKRLPLAASLLTLGLSTQAEEEHVVAGEQRVGDLGDDRVVVSTDAGEDGLAGLEPCNEVFSEFLLDRAVSVSGFTELAEGRGAGVCVCQAAFRG